MKIDLSIIIPLYNETESLEELSSWIHKVVQESKLKYEIVFIDDGSTDNSWATINSLQKRNNNIKALSFRRNYGKSAALNVGFNMSKGDVVITMDADLQDSPDEIPELYKMIKEDGFDIVSGWKRIGKIHCQKLFLQNYITLSLERFQESNFTI